MKKIISTILSVAVVGVLLSNCSGSKTAVKISEEEKSVFAQKDQDTVVIANAEAEYEIFIIEPGFYSWLVSIARPEGYYSQHFLENRNELMVMEWNRRAINPQQYDPQLYLWQINYEPTIDYGYEVNYKLYFYFIYFQRKYKQRLGPYQPRI
ncbi:MAG: DUF6146 family protein [Flavobacteriaceae bacterium]